MQAYNIILCGALLSSHFIFWRERSFVDLCSYLLFMDTILMCRAYFYTI